MGIRPKAIAWLENNHGIDCGLRYTSKLYLPEEAWNKEKEWWFEIPVDILAQKKLKFVHFVCEKKKNTNLFYYLRVPLTYLKANKKELFIRNKKSKKCFSLYFSAQKDTLFQELRGGKNFKFGGFLVK